MRASRQSVTTVVAARKCDELSLKKVSATANDAQPNKIAE